MVTGAGGMLGADVVAVLGERGHRVTAAARADLDITDAVACRRAVAGHEVVLNCAAWTAVDDAESDEAAASAVNASGAAALADATAAHGARMVQVSTDYVFAGDATTPYSEDAATDPRSAYGRTKAAGEEAVRARCPDSLVVRTAWLYGRHGPCFPRTMARLLTDRAHVDVVDDQVGQPTWTRDVADLVERLATRDVPAGTYHATASGAVSWCGFTRAVAASLDLAPSRVRATTSDAFVRPAPRPAYSVLGHDALEAVGVVPIGNWLQRWQSAAETVLTTR